MMHDSLLTQATTSIGPRISIRRMGAYMVFLDIRLLTSFVWA
jgi:hypothetical protein